MKAWGPGLEFLIPKHKPGVAAHVCNTTTGKAETGSLDLTDQPSLADLVNYRFSERTYFQK